MCHISRRFWRVLDCRSTQAANEFPPDQPITQARIHFSAFSRAAKQAKNGTKMIIFGSTHKIT